MKTFLQLVIVTLFFVPATAQNIPVDFEENGNGADWVWTVFENDTNPALEIIENPDPSGLNASPTVAKFTALQSGQPFAGCETLHGAGIGSFTIDGSNSIIRILVWKSVISDVGIKLVREDNWSLGEIKIANTVTNEWEQIEFDFSSHMGNTYDQIVVFPDFNARESDNIIYFDEIYGDVAVSTNTTAVKAESIQISPNPAIHSINIQSDTPLKGYEMYSITGELVDRKDIIESSTINISHLPKGIYLFKAFSDSGTIIEKFIKE